MRIKQIEVFKYLKHGLPNYGSTEYGAGITVEVGENDNAADVFAWAYHEVSSQVLMQMKNAMEDRRMSTQPLEEELERLKKGGENGKT